MVKVVILSLKGSQLREVILEIGSLWQVEFDNDIKNQEMNRWIRRLKMWNNGLYKSYLSFFVPKYVKKSSD